MKFFFLLALGAGLAINEANGQTDTTRGRSKTDSSRTQRDTRDSSWNRRDTLQRRDSLQLEATNKDGASFNSANNGQQLDDAIAEWPQAHRRAVEELRAKYGEPDVITEQRVVWKEKGNWKMIIVNRDDQVKATKDERG